MGKDRERIVSGELVQNGIVIPQFQTQEQIDELIAGRYGYVSTLRERIIDGGRYGMDGSLCKVARFTTDVGSLLKGYSISKDKEFRTIQGLALMRDTMNPTDITLMETPKLVNAFQIYRNLKEVCNAFGLNPGVALLVCKVSLVEAKPSF